MRSPCGAEYWICSTILGRHGSSVPTSHYRVRNQFNNSEPHNSVVSFAAKASAPGRRSVNVLFLASNPASTERLRIDREARQIREKLLAATHADRVEIIARWAVRIDDVLQSLMEVQPEIVHFSGHATRTEQLLLEDETGRDLPIDTSALAGLFGVLKDRIRLVVLNACYSRPQAQAINQHIDCTIGMGQSLTDEASFEFSAIFYQAIGFGRSIQTAFDLACKILECKRIPGSDTPQLFVRPGVDPGDISLVNGERS